jgi:hypothetical protein
MQRVCEKPFHKWTDGEKSTLSICSSEDVHNLAEAMGLPYETVYAMWKHLRNEQFMELAYFDYSRIQPLKALFTKCPVCKGTTGVNENAYCHSCLSQWNPITLEPLEGLHKPDPVD